MSLCSAYLLKGWLLAERAPAEVMEAVESVIECLKQPTDRRKAEVRPMKEDEQTTASVLAEPDGGEPAEVATDCIYHQWSEDDGLIEDKPPAPKPDLPTPTPPKKKHNWSPEARAAAAERMRKQRAAGMGPQKRASPTQSPSAKQSWAYGKPSPATPHGETSTITDPDGRKVTKLPPGYAIGAEPDQKVRPKNGYGA